MNDAIDFSKLNRALVVKMKHLGDVLLTTPVFQTIKNHYPHILVDALIYDETKPMLQGHPAINSIFTVKKYKTSTGQHLKSELSLLKLLKSNQYDLLIHLTESWRGVWLSKYLNPQYSVVQNYPRRSGKLWRNSFTHHYDIPNNDRRHTVETHLDALRRLGIMPSEFDKQLVLSVDNIELDTIVKKVGASITGDYALIHPTSRWMFKTWDADKMAAVINRVAATGLQIVLTSSNDSKELSILKLINSRLESPVINLAGKLNLRELSVLIKHAKLFLGVDSVPMHMAAALNTPSVVLFGPSNDNKWRPWNSSYDMFQVVASKQHPCRPCDQDGCGNSKVSECLTTLSVDDVWRKVEIIMQAKH